MKVVTVDEMRRLEEACSGIGRPPSTLMENAGRAVAEEVGRILGTFEGRSVLLLVGPGNNGGDGLVAARYLRDRGASVAVYLLSNRPADDVNLRLVRERDITCVEAAQDEGLATLSRLLLTADAVVDAVFGTGRSRPLSGIFRAALEAVGRAQKERPALRVVALDLPSGLDADTGATDPACLYADHTVTLGFPKVGLFNAPGAERVGHLRIVDIGIPAELAEEVTVDLITDDWARSVLPKRPLLANKGSFGRVLVIAGSERYVGAACLACEGAMRAGAGLVTLATTPTLQSILAARLTETTYLPLPEADRASFGPQAARLLREELGSYDVLLIGCGLGQSGPTMDFIREVLLGRDPASLPLVIDADALNTLAKTPDWWQRVPDDAILTPHPGEMSRLARASIDEVQGNRIGTARETALAWQKTVVLKGAYTVVAAPDGKCRVSAVANPGLASAGTGDVLAGAIAGLRGQGLAPSDAAACGVYLHGQAGEVVRARLGDTGMVASDLLPVLPLVIKRLKENRTGSATTE